MTKFISVLVAAAIIVLWSPYAEASACGALSGEARRRCVTLATENVRAFKALKHRHKVCKPFVSARDYTQGRDPGCHRKVRGRKS